MFTITGDTTSGNATILTVPSTAGIVLNQALSGSGIQAGARVLSFVANTSVTMTLTASATANGVTINVALLNYITFSPSSSLAAAVLLSAASLISFSPASSLNGSLAMTVAKTVAVGARPASSLNGSLAMIVAKTVAVAALPTSSLKGSLALSGVAGVTFCEVVNEVLNLWGIEGTCNAPDFAIARAIGDINSAMQTVWNQADERDYWSSETLTLTFADGEDSKDLPDNIQNVVGPCRRSDNKRPLATIATIGELETFSDLYLDGETADEPLAYHIERMNQSGDDPVKTVLRITPAVDGASIAFLLDVVREATRYNSSDLVACPIIPIPHRYTESLLLPIVRYKASSFWLFNNTDSKATIDRDYQMAMSAIGLADPGPGKPPEKEGSPAK